MGTEGMGRLSRGGKNYITTFREDTKLKKKRITEYERKGTFLIRGGMEKRKKKLRGIPKHQKKKRRTSFFLFERGDVVWGTLREVAAYSRKAGRKRLFPS